MAEEIEATDQTLVDLRIRFAGLCLWVSGPGSQTHVLFPRTNINVGGVFVPQHDVNLYYYRRGTCVATKLPEGKHELPASGGKPERKVGVFDLSDLPTADSAKCSEMDRGKVDPETRAAYARIRLKGGTGTVADAGASWYIGTEIHQMPVTVDWWVRGVRAERVREWMSAWGAGDLDVPTDGNAALVWIFHEPNTSHGAHDHGAPDEKPASEADSRAFSGSGRLRSSAPHFVAYYPLLRCSDFSGYPTRPDHSTVSIPTDFPHWPICAATFSPMIVPPVPSLVNCMMAGSDPWT